MKHTEKHPVTSEIITKKLELYCAYQERCIRDVTSKLKDWNLRESQIEKIIEKLKKDNFINEERFAKSFARGKFKVNKWGRQRIAFELHLKNIPAHMIQAGLNEIDEEEYMDMLKQLILKKRNETGKARLASNIVPEMEDVADDDADALPRTKENNNEKKLNIREKIINFVHNKGYEMSLILVLMNELKI
jgi:regulatory protein